MESTRNPVPVVSPDNEAVGEFDLPASITSQPARDHLLFEMVKMQLASRRAGSASTKTRAYVRGGGRKPWRQKGTGRARAGSSRSPIWVGGATVFGPQPRSYAYRLPRSARRTALRAALAQKHRDDALVVVSDLALPEPKTKRMIEILSRLHVGDSVLIVLTETNGAAEKSARNLPRAKALHADGLNVYDVLRYRKVLFTREALRRVSERLD